MTTIKKSLDELSISDERIAELAAMSDEDIGTSDIPELSEEFWQNARVRFDEDVVQ